MGFLKGSLGFWEIIYTNMTKPMTSLFTLLSSMKDFSHAEVILNYMLESQEKKENHGIF